MKSFLDIQALDQDHPCRETVAEWLHLEWGEETGLSLAETLSRLGPHEGCPSAQVAMIGGSPVGMVSFLRHPMPGDKGDRDSMGLWLNALFVVPEQRKRGISSALVRRAVEQAAGEVLYVYTAIPEFYLGKDWVSLRPRDQHGNAVLAFEVRD